MTRAIRVTRADDGSVSTVLETGLTDDQLGDGDVLVDISHSGINYKDGMALAGNPGVARVSPLIPGIDLVGRVASSTSADWSVGDQVIVNGWGIGETRNGGLAERASVDSSSLVALPAGMSPARAAAIGTAGFTAALSVLALEGADRSPAVPGSGGVRPGDGDILVTGASGGVGSIAVALLAAAGYRVVASTGRPEHREYLLSLGAAETVDRAEFESAGRPLLRQRWAGVIDSVGGQTLATAIAETNYGGTVTACGLVGGVDVPLTVLPFILRGVSLVGINSVECPPAPRHAAWARLARDLDYELLDRMTTVVPLEGAIDAGAAILRGELRGRTVVDVRA